MKRIIVLIALATLAWGQAPAQESPLWLRKSAISPDGTQIAFCYKGDIYLASTNGGAAVQLTTNSAYDSDPVWTPDGKQIYFSSTREGSKDVWLTTPLGGTPKQITNYPGSETPKAVLPDGRIAFTASLQADPAYGEFPGDPQVWAAGNKEERPQLLTSITMSEFSVRPDGAILYEDYKGYEDPFRKHHTSAVTRDVWFLQDGKYTQLSTYEGENRQPVFCADGDTYYYLSEQGGTTINLWRSSVSNPARKEQITHYAKDPVRYISVAQDGTVAYSQNGELYILKPASEPRKLELTLTHDESEREMVKMNLSNATDMALSPDGKEIAVVIRGDIFVTSVDYSTTRRITNTPSQERGVDFSKDGRTLYYAAERDGNWGIWSTTLTDKKEKLFTYATRFKEELFSEPGETSFQPDVSPDGKWVAYLRDRTELVIKPAKGGKVRSMLKGANYSYQDGDQSFEWSPDSEYLLATYQADGGWNNPDIALIEVDNGNITNLTQSGYSDGGFRWALGGKAITWYSDKNGYRSHGSWGAEEDVYIMFFDGKAMTDFLMDKEDEELEKLLSGKSEKQIAKEEKKDSLAAEKPKKMELLLDGRQERVRRLTDRSASYGDHYLSKDGRTLYYVTPLESGMGLCSKDLRKGDIKVIARGVTGGITPSADGGSIFVFSGRGIKKVTLPGGQVKNIDFSGEFEFKPKAERQYIFEHCWKQVQEKFYDPALHGVDWAYYKENYSRFLPYIDNYYDFQELLSEMLGELNGSHTGARFRPVGGGESLGRLGVLYDLSYGGEGIKIAEVLPGGVLNLADSEIKAGDVILAINGQQIAAGENWFPLLAGKAGKKTSVTVRKGGKEVDLIVKPVVSEANLLYRRWVRQREEMVERLSGGRVGYVHVQGMNSPSFREVYSNALGKYRTCDALIVDTRHNGGGWLHDDLVTFLSGKAYVYWQPRGQYIGTEPYSKWTKPSCVLMGEDNYSDASGFPYAYKALEIGKLIGMPVPGTMTAVWWETQINPSIVFGIPQVGGWMLKEQRYMENYQLEPDVRVANDPASLLAGRDIQLEKAVEEMLK